MDTVNNGMALALFAIIVFSTLLTTLYVYNLDLSVDNAPAVDSAESAKVRVNLASSQAPISSTSSGQVAIKINEGS